MFELSLINVKKYMESTLVLEDVSFDVYSGEKVGIVGVNGSGKSTILKLIAGLLEMEYCVGYPGATMEGYDEGFIKKPKDAICAYLEQMPQYEEGLKVIDVLKTAFKEVYEIEINMRTLEEQIKNLSGKELDIALNKYSKLLEQYEIKGGYNIENSLAKICTGLKFSEEFIKRDFNSLSGGEKTSVILGKILMSDTDILLLDEPTNHLDMESIEWLERFLKEYKGIVIVVSHDRYFLDNTVDKIVEIEDKKSKTYKGNYSDYVKQKEENFLIDMKFYEQQEKQIKNIERKIKELRQWAIQSDNGKFFKRAANLEKRINRMKYENPTEIEGARKRGGYTYMENPKSNNKTMKINFKDAQRSGNDVIKVEGLCKSFDDRVLFKNVDLLVRFRERVGIIGGNGSGKTTLIKMLLGEEKQDSGILELGDNVKIGYLPQVIKFDNEEGTILDTFRDSVSMVEGKAREYLSKFMFFGKSVFKKVKVLSGGERIRLKLAIFLYQDINLLILDEPTNHLDVDSIETLEEALQEFKGTILFISHDRYFINKVAERVVEIEKCTFNNYLGNYDYYKEIKDRNKTEVVKIEERKQPKQKVKKKIK